MAAARKRSASRTRAPANPSMIERMTAIETSFENAMNTLGDRIELAVSNAVNSLAKSAEVEALRLRVEALEKTGAVQSGQMGVIAYWMERAFPWAALTGGVTVAMSFVGVG